MHPQVSIHRCGEKVLPRLVIGEGWQPVCRPTARCCRSREVVRSHPPPHRASDHQRKNGRRSTSASWRSRQPQRDFAAPRGSQPCATTCARIRDRRLRLALRQGAHGGRHETSQHSQDHRDDDLATPLTCNLTPLLHRHGFSDEQMERGNARFDVGSRPFANRDASVGRSLSHHRYDGANLSRS